jgi:hypothetical protein
LRIESVYFENETVCVDCGDVVEFDIGEVGGDVVGEFDIETVEGVEIGGDGGGQASLKQKISTILE